MKKNSKLRWATLGAGLLASSMLVPKGHAQSSEALMDALVRKGILTEQEAEDIKADVSKENKQFNKWSLNKDGLEYKLYGDVRGRYEMFRAENEAPTDTRTTPPPRSRTNRATGFVIACAWGLRRRTMTISRPGSG
jgi:hypothetical protein